MTCSSKILLNIKQKSLYKFPEFSGSILVSSVCRGDDINLVFLTPTCLIIAIFFVSSIISEPILPIVTSFTKSFNERVGIFSFSNRSIDSLISCFFAELILLWLKAVTETRNTYPSLVVYSSTKFIIELPRLIKLLKNSLAYSCPLKMVVAIPAFIRSICTKIFV